ncbi:uncharacterized protein EKO05_0001498 [Ascochyta rabiei]|nr:uncharacterized protein EKO05_0001498 [Ascochyta rabiei]UPX10861.1 hypothetical protein EKO05_0001498 [Ascochyta rabiei]
MREQLDMFAQSHSMYNQTLEESQNFDGRNSLDTRTNDKGLEGAAPDTTPPETLARSKTLETEDQASGETARSETDHVNHNTRRDGTDDARISTVEAGKNDERRKRSGGTGGTVHRKVFRKAAQCLQRALDADGVLFADGLVGFHGEVQPTAEPELELVREFAQPPWGEKDVCEGKPQSNTRTFTSSEYLKGVHIDRPTEVFGSADRSDQLNPSPTSKLSAGLPGIDDGFLGRLMDSHPAGAIWYLTDTYILQVREETLFEVDLQEELARLRVTFPNAKQLMYVPLIDPTSAKRLCACFAWRNQTSPTFTSAADLSSLQVFLHVVESEIGRYDTAAASKQKEIFVSSVSHELRTPLHGILGAVQLLDESGLDPLQKSLASIITSCGSTLHETLTSVLSYAKINQFERRQNENRHRRTSDPQWALTEKQGLASGPDRDFKGLYTRTNVAILCEETVGVAESGRSFQNSADEEVIVVCNISYEENWSYFTESGALRRIAVNLIGNALKYTKKGSVIVSLTASRLVKDPLRASNELTYGRTLTLSVKDTGRGMSKDFLQNHLFIPFTQEDSTSSNGVGLGMSIVKSLVTLLSGEIQVRSDVGSGTEIEVRLPMRMCDSKDENESSATFIFEQNIKVLRTRRLSIIMFGFPEFVRESLKAYLCEWYNCVLLDHSENAKPDIVLVDEGNEEVLDEIKRTAHVYGLQAVLLSAVLVISRMGKRMDTIRGYKKWERIPRPIGPRNVGKGLLGCLPKLDELRKYGNDAKSDTLDSQSKFDERTGELSSDSTKNVPNELPMWALKRLQVSQHARTEALKAERPTSHKFANRDQEPVRPDQLSNPDSAKSNLVPNTGLRILLVDDNELNLKLLGVFFKRNGYHNTQKARDGLEAVHAVKERQEGFDVVFMDLSMPIMDGFEATRTIRKLEAEQIPPAATKAVFIVALTGLASANDEKKAFDAGVDMYLTKPVQFSRLSVLLREYTDRTSETSKLAEESQS